jgi:hypothetical protein
MIILHGKTALLETSDVHIHLEALEYAKYPVRRLVRHGIDHLLYQTTEGAGIVIAGARGTIGTEKILQTPALVAGWYTETGTRSGFLYRKDGERLVVPEEGAIIPGILIEGDLEYKAHLDIRLKEFLGLGKGPVGHELGLRRELDPVDLAAKIRTYDPHLRK